MKFAAATAALLASGAAATDFSVCSGKTDSLGITSVDFSEMPVVPGSTLTIEVDATPKTEVTEGATLTFDIKLGAFVLYSVTKDFCADLGVTCPLPAGTPVTASVDVDVKSSSPSASVTAEVTAVNGDGKSLSCIDIPMTIAAQLGSEALPVTLDSSVNLTEELVATYFGAFKSKFGKEYSCEKEEATRMSHFGASLKRAQQRNVDSGDATFGVTKFSDMSVEEFKATMLTYKPEENKRFGDVRPAAASRNLRQKAWVAGEDSHDCRDDGSVTAVKDQGQCGSCWAFSTAEEVESAYFMAGNPLTELSVAQIVQCDTGDGGCNGGDTITGFDYVQSAGGLALDKDYPYAASIGRGKTGTCQDGFDVVDGTSVKEYRYATPECTTRKCDSQDEDTLAQNLSSDGPVSICVNAESWQDYTSGTLSSSSCGGNGYYKLDHCVQLIGYDGISGSDGYWIVRNSWADDWGVDGMIHLAFGDNTCGVADEATQLTLE
ncbi:hypothetical protein TeGR_g13802 [Tetraparma gracilis]|uniref:Peptidase C1A papain C-terminal domain-containing protein n=1 Tax=Tetraparma gracilis TaxID=2962635 RepID=A0ABQ6MBZ9_9STRA|nr:hypothetical protein TeGR_g13802 [Tetraparma gracilis]